MTESADLPIQNLEAIDILGKRRDDGVDLMIVTSAHLNGSKEIQELLLNKVESYLEQLNGEEFSTEFGAPSPERVRIIVRCIDEPDEEIRDLVARCQGWASDNNASILWVVGDG